MQRVARGALIADAATTTTAVTAAISRASVKWKRGAYLIVFCRSN